MKKALDDSFARKVLLVEMLPSNCSPLYEKLPDDPSFVIKEDGVTVHREDEGFLSVFQPRCRQVKVPFFSYTSSTNRIQLEEEGALALLDAASSCSFCDPLSPSLISKAISSLENLDVPASSLVISSEDRSKFEDIFSVSFIEDLTPSLVSYTGQVQGLDVYVHPSCHKGTVYMLTDSEYLGRVVLTPDEPYKCGLLVFNPRTVLKLTVPAAAN